MRWRPETPNDAQERRQPGKQHNWSRNFNIFLKIAQKDAKTDSNQVRSSPMNGGNYRRICCAINLTQLHAVEQHERQTTVKNIHKTRSRRKSMQNSINCQASQWLLVEKPDQERSHNDIQLHVNGQLEGMSSTNILKWHPILNK